ncbi:hypothetical protein IFM89_008465, partial [Coptis chinensis]
MGFLISVQANTTGLVKQWHIICHIPCISVYKALYKSFGGFAIDVVAFINQLSSFSSWIFTVGTAAYDRVYSNSLILGNNITILGTGLAPGTDNGTMYTLVAATHALSNETTDVNNMYLGECQDSNSLNRDLVQGSLLICSYSIRFVLDLSTIKNALETAGNLSAAGVIFYMDPLVIGFQLNPTPMAMPGVIIPSSDDSK